MEIFIKNGVIKQREEVQQTIYKKHFDTDYTGTNPGPYYDPNNTHCHVWKPVRLIQNFKGEQNQTDSKYRKHDEIPTKGLYCCICHFRLKSKGYNLQKELDLSHYSFFKKRKSDNEDDLVETMKTMKITKISPTLLWDRFYILLARSHIEKYRRIYTAVLHIKAKEKQIIHRWSSLVKKLLGPVVYYNISSFSSIPLKLSDMTYFQRFKYNNPNYRKESSFIIYDNTFEKNFVTIT